MLNMNNCPKINFEDIDKYKNGGIMITNEFKNGYNLYIPYGVSMYLSSAIDDSLRLMKEKQVECEKNINELKKIDNEKAKHIQEYYIKNQTEWLTNLKNGIKVLEKIQTII